MKNNIKEAQGLIQEVLNGIYDAGSQEALLLVKARDKLDYVASETMEQVVIVVQGGISQISCASNGVEVHIVDLDHGDTVDDLIYQMHKVGRRKKHEI